MPRFLNAALLGAALIIPVVMTPAALRADDRTYHDKQHNDDHHWDRREDRAYRTGLKRTIASIGTFPGSKRKISNHTGPGVTSIQTTNEELIDISPG